MSQAAKFKAMLKSGKMIVAPGAYDAITARVIAQAGFPAVSGIDRRRHRRLARLP